MVRNGIDVTPDIEQQIVHHEERGQTVVLTAINSECHVYIISSSLKAFCIACKPREDVVSLYMNYSQTLMYNGTYCYELIVTPHG